MHRFLGFLLLVPLAASCSGSTATVCGRGTRPDRKAPSIEGPSIEDGSIVRLEAGQPMIVNVWGSWCGPCRLEEPVLVRAASSHPDVRFLGLDVQDNDASGRAFRKEFGVTYPSISDHSYERASRLGDVFAPTTFAIDRLGTIRGEVQESIDVDTLECMIGLARG
jgi:thiol-disulfide isomerase/thioredoxin